MNGYKKIFLAILSLALSCKSQNNNKEKVKLKLTDKVKIPIDSTINYRNHPIDYRMIEKTEEIRFINLKNELVTIDINTKKIQKNYLNFEGPNGIGNAETLSSINKSDSIIIKNHQPNALILATSKGIKLAKYQLKDNTEEGKRGIYSQANSSIQIWNNNAIAFLHPTLNREKNLMELNSRPFISINLNSGESTILPFYFPYKFRANPKKWSFIHYEPSYIVNKNKLIASFPACDSIFVFDLKSGTQNTFYCRSKYIDKEIAGNPVNTMNDLYDAYRKSYSYNILKYDPYNNIYYRFLLHPSDTETNDYTLTNITLVKGFSIQVLDSNFNTLTESDIFQELKYDFYDCFVGKKGLYISNNHPKNENSIEDELSYNIFTITDNK